MPLVLLLLQLIVCAFSGCLLASCVSWTLQGRHIVILHLRMVSTQSTRLIIMYQTVNFFALKIRSYFCLQLIITSARRYCVLMCACSFVRSLVCSLTSGQWLQWLASTCGWPTGGHTTHRQTSNQLADVLYVPGGDLHPTSIFTVRRSLHGICYSNSVRPSVCPSVCLSVCLSHSWTVSTWFDLRS